MRTLLLIFYKILLFTSILVFSGFFFSSTIHAQNLLVEEGQAAVRVYNENLVKAKTRALGIAKRDLLTRSLSRFLDPKDIERIFPLLTRYILDTPDQFIESIRIIKESPPKDIRTFFLTVEGKIFRSRMVSALKKLALPLKTEAPLTRTLLLSIDNESVFWQDPDRNLILEQLKASFAPYQVTLQSAPTTAPSLTSLLPQTLVSPFPQVDLSFTTRPQWSPGFTPFPVTAGVSLKLYHPQDHSVLSTLYVQQVFREGSLSEIAQTLFNKLILQWSSLFHALSALDQKEGVLSKIKLTGISGFQEEKQVMNRLFMNNPHWENLYLNSLSPQSVIYEGKYSGRKEDAVTALLQFNEQNKNPDLDPPFRLHYAGWQKGTLLVHVKWKTHYAELELYQPSFELEQQFIQAQKAEEPPLPAPVLQVPLTPRKSIYALPQNTFIYDHIKTRGDSTLFKVELPAFTRSLTLQWYRVGNTNLRPKLTVYNQKRMPQKEYRMGQQNTLTTRYNLPSEGIQKATPLFIGVSDEFGYVKDVVGGYQSFGYILRVGKSPVSIPEL